LRAILAQKLIQRSPGHGPEASFESRSGRLIDEGLFRRKPSRDLIYERTTVFERKLGADFLAHDVIPSSMDAALLGD
jgi:hypothetical protein